MQPCYPIIFKAVATVLASCKDAYLISSARSEVVIVFIMHSCHQAFLQLSHSLFYEVGVTIQTVWISHACLTSDNVNPKTCSVQGVQHTTTP